jgi:single-strand selective monofunctional uracil DNA glycosylase
MWAGYARAVSLASISRRLSARVEALEFGAPVAYVYNPLVYAREPHEHYLELYGQAPKQALLVGMNPGPFGMAQTGVPFGDVEMVRGFLGVEGRVGKPRSEHPKRPVQGFGCKRSEVSGTRLWGWAEERFQTPRAFFERYFVYNYCPLAFMESSGRNRTPDKLAPAERERLYEICNDALRDVVTALEPRWVIGVGAFAEKRARDALGNFDVRIGAILHPSPASPKANQGWAKIVNAELAEYGLG